MDNKPLVWLHGEVKTPPLTPAGRLEIGMLLRRLQRGELLSMPFARPMPSIGAKVYELRVTDNRREWRIIYRLDADAVVVGDVFAKTTQRTPKRVIDECQRRFSRYDEGATE